jgi:4-hydroxy-tetrahydrodipicolinate reductase
VWIVKPIKVVVQGASGRVGQELVKAICQEPETELVGAVELGVSDDYLTLPDGSGRVLFTSSLANIITSSKPDVVVDFTIAKATMPVVRIAAENGIHLVIGTTGLTADDLDEIDRLAKAGKVGAVVAPNFALGAILMMHFAKIAARYVDYAEIIELHHDTKADAPSGTALSTARAMAAAKGKPLLQPSGKGETAESRGQKLEGITIHSVRLPGLLAHQEVILGAAGQTLSIRHDTIGRECYMPGVILAVKKVAKHRGLVHGLDTLLGL